MPNVLSAAKTSGFLKFNHINYNCFSYLFESMDMPSICNKKKSFEKKKHDRGCTKENSGYFC